MAKNSVVAGEYKGYPIGCGSKGPFINLNGPNSILLNTKNVVRYEEVKGDPESYSDDSLAVQVLGRQLLSSMCALLSTPGSSNEFILVVEFATGARSAINLNGQYYRAFVNSMLSSVPGKDQVQKKKSHVFLVIGILACVFVVILIAEAIHRAGQEPSSSTQTSWVSVPSPSVAVSDAPEAPQPSTSDLLQVGDTSELSDWAFSVTGFHLVTEIEDGFYSFSPDDGNQFAVVTVSATNNGTEADSFLSSVSIGDDIRAKLIYKDEYEYTATNLIGYDDTFYYNTVNPLSTLEGNIIFEVPDTVADGTDALTIRFSSGINSAEFKLR